jgi:hypothetical protein
MAKDHRLINTCRTSDGLASIEVPSMKRCARCGQDHGPIDFDRFINPPPNVTHWAPCPATGEPILLRLVDHAGDVVEPDADTEAQLPKGGSDDQKRD